MGSGRDAFTEEELDKYQITHILNVAKEFQSASHEGIENHKIFLEDIVDQPLHPHLDSALDFVEKAAKQGGRVLVHCVVGRSRSPAVIVAYLMKCKGKSMKDALAHVKQAREIGINTGK